MNWSRSTRSKAGWQDVAPKLVEVKDAKHWAGHLYSPLCPFKKSNQVLSFHVFRFAELFLESLGPFSRNLYTETSQIWRFGSGRPPILSWELEKQQQSNIGFTPFDAQGFQCTGRAVVSCCLTGRSTWCFLLGDAMKHLSRGISAGSFHLGCMVKCTKGISVLWCYWCFRSAWITWRALWATLRTTTTRFEDWQWLLGDTCTSFWGCLFSAFQVLQLQRSDSAKLSSELRTHQVKRLIGKSAFVRSCAWFLALFYFSHACKITQFGAAVSTCLKLFRSHPNNYHSWFLAMCDCHHLLHLIFMCHNSVTTSKSHRSLYIVWSIVAPKRRSCCSFRFPMRTGKSCHPGGSHGVLGEANGRFVWEARQGRICRRLLLTRVEKWL